MSAMQVVIPMAGSGSRFLKAGYTAPKPLLDVAGKPLIERLMEQFPKDWKFVFIPNEDHLRTTAIKNVLLNLAPSAKIAAIPAHKKGPAHTLLAAADSIDDDLPTIINYCDFSFRWDPNDFLAFTRRTACDGAVVCYRGFHPHYLDNNPYAYCREENGRILEIKEKGWFTDDRQKEFASSGTYYFSSGRLAKEACRQAVLQNLVTNGEYYMSLVYNPLIQSGKKVLVYEIPFFLQWGTPEDLEDYLYWHRTFEAFEQNSREPGPQAPRLVMPMAGSGTRFQGFDLPKPLIPVLGQPMYKTAQQFLPVARQNEVLVLQRPLESAVRKASPHATIIVLDGPTAGQADTTQLALAPVDPDEPVLISACDHGLLWDTARWEGLLAQEPDLIVIGQSHYPGARRKPNHFAYIDAAGNGKIRQVSVKQPMTDRPQSELVLVGTFYARRAKILQEAVHELIQRDIRVNGERYLDSVVPLLIEKGLDVRCFEADAFLNWGSPDALAEFSYWHHYFRGVPA